MALRVILGAFVLTCKKDYYKRYARLIERITFMKAEEFEESDKVKVTDFLRLLECVWDNNGELYHEINILFKYVSDRNLILIY